MPDEAATFALHVTADGVVTTNETPEHEETEQ